MSRRATKYSPLALVLAGSLGTKGETAPTLDVGNPDLGAFAYEMLMMAGASPDSATARVDANMNSSPYFGVPSVFVDMPRSTPDVICTGVAIGARTILTAGHCLDSNGSGASNGTGLTASQVSVRFNGSGAAVNITASSMTLNPTFSGSPSLFDDLGIIQLSSDIPTGAQRYSLLPDGILNPATPDRDVFRIDFVGYGQSGNGSTTGSSALTVAESRTTKRIGANLVESGSTDDEGNGKPELFRFDFEATTSGPRSDAPPAFGTASYNWYDGNSAHNVYGTTSVTLDNTVESLPGPGDSGGPAFVTDASGQLFLAGLVTFRANVRTSTDGGFGSIGGGVWLPSYLSWIEETSGITAPAVSLFDDGVPDVPPNPNPNPTPPNNVVNPVPEPSTYVAALIVAALAGSVWRNRRRS